MKRTPVLVLAALTAACSRYVRPASPGPVPAPAPAEAPPSPALPILLVPVDSARYCVVREGRLQDVAFDLRDSTYQGQPLARAFPLDSTYAGNRSWYASAEPITVLGGTFAKYGRPRIVGPTELVPVATFRGVTVFAEEGKGSDAPKVIYVPTRPGCEFQPYVRPMTG